MYCLRSVQELRTELDEVKRDAARRAAEVDSLTKQRTDQGVLVERLESELLALRTSANWAHVSSDREHSPAPTPAPASSSAPESSATPPSPSPTKPDVLADADAGADADENENADALPDVVRGESASSPPSTLLNDRADGSSFAPTEQPMCLDTPSSSQSQSAAEDAQTSSSVDTPAAGEAGEPSLAPVVAEEEAAVTHAPPARAEADSTCEPECANNKNANTDGNSAHQVQSALADLASREQTILTLERRLRELSNDHELELSRFNAERDTVCLALSLSLSLSHTHTHSLTHYIH